MPYVEVIGPPADETQKVMLARSVTGGIVDGFGVRSETVTIYFLPVAAEDYAHAGVLGGGPGQRILVKLHAFRRDAAQRRAVACSVTAGVAESLGTDPEVIAVYFFDRDPGEVAHAGKLASD